MSARPEAELIFTIAPWENRFNHVLRGSDSTVLTATSEVGGKWRTLAPYMQNPNPSIDEQFSRIS